MWKFFFLDCWWLTKEYWLEAETALRDPVEDLLDSAAEREAVVRAEKTSSGCLHTR